MRIAWVTPYQKSSAIARFSRLVAEAFDSRGHSITLIASDRLQLTENHPPPAGTGPLHWSFFELYPAAVDAYDLVVYNIGDHYERNFGSLRLIDRYPGVCIIHDVYLVDLFLGWAGSGVQRNVAHSVVSSLYGENVANQFWNRVGQPDFFEWSVAEAPMTEWIARKALAAVAHAPFYKRRLTDGCAGPVSVVALAYDAPKTLPVVRDKTGSVRILTVGTVNKTNRVESVIRTIAASPTLRDRCEYDIVGQIETPYKIALQAQIEDLKLNRTVRLHGYIDDFELGNRFAESDIVCSLRLPALEGASASCIEAMLYGKAVLVMDTGFYSSIPSDIVLKVRPTDEIEDLRQNLEMLVLNAGKRQILSGRAKDWAELEYAPDAYVQRIEPLLEAAVGERPLFEALSQISLVLQTLRVQSEDLIVRQIGSEFQKLFCSGKPRGQDGL
ncbi:MAG: glycosyltransferase family 4 protein [Verrucomicrobia bacterium]|nr:glycosyltransferase family 4 protein [Verrucomicrobiota bacterium]